MKLLQLLHAAKEDDDDEPGESLKAFRKRATQEQRGQICNVLNQALDNALVHFDGIALRYDTLKAARCMADESDSEDDIDDVLQAVAIME